MTDPTPASSFEGPPANLRAAVLREHLDLPSEHRLQPVLAMLDRALAGEDLRDCDRTALKTIERAAHLSDEVLSLPSDGPEWCFAPGVIAPLRPTALEAPRGA